MKQLTILFKKDIFLFWRDTSSWIAGLAFGVISIILYALAIDIFILEIQLILPGLMWVTFLFFGILITSNSFENELNEGFIDGLRIMNVPMVFIAISKILVNFIFIFSTEMVLIFISVLFFNIEIKSYTMLIPISFITLGFVSLLTCLSPISYKAPTGTIITYIFGIPLLIPLILAATKITYSLFGITVLENHWLLLGILFSFWQIIMSVILFQFIINE